MAEKPTYEELKQRIRDLEQAESDRRGLKKAYHKLEKYCEAMERIDQAIRRTDNAHQILDKVTEEVSRIFRCDRAWLFYPCNPSAASFRVVAQSAHPDYPGVKAPGIESPMSADMTDYCRRALLAGGEAISDPPDGREISDDIATECNAKTLLLMALHPKIGDAWMFGLHQYDHRRDWTGEEKSLFQQIGFRVNDVLSSMLYLQRLEESEYRYRQLFEMESDAIFIIENVTGRILEVNHAASSIYGYTREEFLERKDTDISAEPDETRKAIETQKTTIPIRYHKKKDGTIFPVEITATYFTWQGCHVHMATIRDITFRIRAEEEKSELEKRLQQSQKMEALGTLAGGIAHDFNNILSPIMIHSEMAMMELSPDSPVQNSLKQILKSGKRARDLVKQILTFARKKQGERIPIEISRILKEVIKLLRSSIPTTIDIHHHIQTKQDTVLVDPTQLQQIIMNLCTNAAHAMRGGNGVLEVRLCDIYIGRDEAVRFADLNPGHYLRMSVSDTGSGIPPELINKVFEPYFTTKIPGEGTGLGLSIVHGIVKNYNGDIMVESEIGRGTAFHVFLPIIDQEVSPGIEQKEQIPNGTERILFVDDEKAAVDTNQFMLERLGYAVTARTSSIEALEAFRNRPDDFDLVITDMTMPNMTGKELARELMSIRSGIPIILCTGFSEQMDEKKAKAMGISAFVMKPVVMREMADTIREVLDKSQQRNM